MNSKIQNGFTKHHFLKNNGGNNLSSTTFWKQNGLLSLPSTTFRKLKSGAGFTLTEVFVVISIIGILALISFPVLRNFQPTLQLNGIVRELVSGLRLTQQLAVSEQVEYCFILPDNFPSNRAYQIIQCGESQFFEQGIIPVEIIGLTIVPSLSNNEVRYNSYGAAKESAQITIENVQNKTKTINVRPSGFIRVID